MSNEYPTPALSAPLFEDLAAAAEDVAACWATNFDDPVRQAAVANLDERMQEVRRHLRSIGDLP